MTLIHMRQDGFGHSAAPSFDAEGLVRRVLALAAFAAALAVLMAAAIGLRLLMTAERMPAFASMLGW